MHKHIVVFSGAGISAESGIQTFRDSGGLWEQHAIEDVATPEAFARNPTLVLDFYNMRRRNVLAAQPNAAHIAIAKLQQHAHAGNLKVSVITQNIDDLHERAGSTNVLHLHGEILKARSCADENLIYDIPLRNKNDSDIHLGDLCEKGHQLRPHIVWFGEAVPMFDKACDIAATADILLVVGTSLAVYPAASLVNEVNQHCEIYVIDPHIEKQNSRWHLIRDTAANGVPTLVEQLIAELSVTKPSLTERRTAE